MKFKILLPLLFIFSNNCLSQVKVILRGVNEIVYPITPNETNNVNELVPLKTIFNKQKVVGMGEATHGTKEFFNMKAKMFKFLVLNCGYRIFSIEATYGGTLKVNRYVLYRKGDILTAMKGMEFWTWDTEEVRDLIEWMSIYNIDKPENEKVRFYGFDCQSFKEPTDALIDYVQDFDKENLNGFKKCLSVLNDSSRYYFWTIKHDKSSFQRIVQIDSILSNVKKWFLEKEDFYISASGKSDFNLTRHNIEVLMQALLLKKCSDKKRYTVRDSCMAQNIKWIYELEHSPVFSWAHNNHISKNEKYFFNKYKTMGAYLNDIFGESYYNIGFVFNQGSFQALNKVAGKLQEFNVSENKKNSLTKGLSLAGINNFFIEMSSTNNRLFQSPKRTYDIGAIYNPKQLYLFTHEMNAKQQFNALIFINTTTSAVSIKRNYND